MKKLLLALAFLFVASPMFAATYYVSKTGSDAHGCSTTDSAGTNKLTLAAGMTCLSGGDTLLIHTGTYAERLNFFEDGTAFPNGASFAAATKISAYPGSCSWTTFTLSTQTNSCETVILAPTSGNHIIEVAGASARQYIIFSGLRLNMGSMNCDVNNACSGMKVSSGSIHIRFTAGECYNGGLCFQLPEDASTSEITYNYAHDITGHWNPPYPAFYVAANNNLVDHNIVNEVVGECIQVYQFGGTPTDNTVSNNVFSKCNHKSATDQDGSGSGIIAAGLRTLVFNNTVINTYGINFGDGITVYGSCQSCGVYYNTSYGNHKYGIEVNAGATSSILRNNIIFNNGGTIQDGGSATSQQDNPTVDPKFTNAAGYDFTLMSTSPVRDSVTCLGSITTTDQAGTTRPQGSNCEPGAFEFTASGTPPLEVYVSTSGSDSNAGTSTGAPFLTLNKGLQTISAKGTVFLCAAACDGTGSAIFTVAIDDSVQAPASGDSTQSTVIRPYAGETITIRPTTGCEVVKLASADYISIKNLILDAANLACSGSGTVTQDHLDASGTQVDTATETFTNFGPIGNNSNRLLVDMVGSNVFKNSLTSVTFNGTSLTRYAGDDADSHGGGFAAMEMWYQLQPAVTTANLVANFNRSDAGPAQTGFSLAGVNQTTPFRNSTVTGGNSGTSVNLSVTTVANDLVIGCVQLRNGGMSPGAITVSAGTEIEQVDDGSTLSYTCAYLQASGVLTTLSFTWVPASAFAAVAVAVEPASTSSMVTAVSIGSGATNFTLDTTEVKNAANAGVAVASAGFTMHGGSIHNTGAATTDVALKLTGASAVIDSNADIYSNLGIAVSVEANTGSIFASSFHANGGAATLQTSGSITGLKIYNNLIYDNTGKGIAITANSPTVAAIYHNTVFRNGDVGIHVTAGSGHLVKNNITYVNTSADATVSSGTASNNLATNPLFVNAPTDFHIPSNSPAVNAGTSLAEPLVDKDGISRPVGLLPDEGAYEFPSNSANNLLNIFAAPGIR